ncbi:unnamed protein product [Lactuca virosa]|uniref:Uncharacterized protein n=1 Tax=Lactuca virosa TaxID=75947 RepID=A0AAU9MBF0_9ASTR|nr:unnamed protein product [Lactuca virosa]
MLRKKKYDDACRKEKYDDACTEKKYDEACSRITINSGVAPWTDLPHDYQELPIQYNIGVRMHLMCFFNFLISNITQAGFSLRWESSF